jgi:hypothetical protein
MGALEVFHHLGTHGAAVAREIPVYLEQPQGHPFKSGWVHLLRFGESCVKCFLSFDGRAEVLFL